MNSNLKELFIISYLCFILIIGYGSAQEEYSDNFNSLDLSQWTSTTSDTWNIVNGTVSIKATRTGLIFQKWSGKQYISKVDFTANDSLIKDFALVGVYIYYKNPDNYGQIWFTDDNRGKDFSDSITIEQKGSTITNINTYINTSSNTSIELNPSIMHHLKVIRLNKNIYVYYDSNLVLTAEFNDENPEGKVGFNVFTATGYFRNFSLRPISMKNASGFINELNLTSSSPTARFGPYTLRLNDITSGSAVFSLSKYGRVVDSAVAYEGNMVALKYENGEEGLEFKVVKAFSGDMDNRVELEDVISASSEATSLGIDNITLLPAYYQGENMSIKLSIKNPGTIKYNGTAALTVNSEGSTQTLNPGLDLAAGGVKNFNIRLKAAKTPGAHKLTVTLKPDEYTTVTKSLDYQVRVLNPVITTLSPDLREDNGIRGTVTVGSAFPDELVDWNTTAEVEVFRILENGKESVYLKEVPVKSKSFDIGISYDEFYREYGRYLVTIKAGGMENDRFFEIKGPGGDYIQSKKEIIPPTVVSNPLYPQLMMLLIGMVAALSVRNHMRPGSRSIPLDIVAVGCGATVFAAGMFLSQTEITSKGMILAGTGFGLLLARGHDPKMQSFLTRGSPIHDFIGLLLVFMSASYLLFLIPEWNLMLTVGTLIVYYTAINMHGERK